METFDCDWCSCIPSMSSIKVFVMKLWRFVLFDLWWPLTFTKIDRDFRLYMVYLSTKYELNQSFCNEIMPFRIIWPLVTFDLHENWCRLLAIYGGPMYQVWVQSEFSSWNYDNSYYLTFDLHKNRRRLGYIWCTYVPSMSSIRVFVIKLWTIRQWPH